MRSQLLFLLFILPLKSWALHFEAATWLSAGYSNYYLESKTTAQKESTPFELNTHETWQWKDDRAFEAQLDLRSDTSATSAQERLLLEPEELNFQFRQGNIKALIGAHREIWEGTDFFNPMDLAAVKNYINPLSPKIRSSNGIFITYDPGLTLDLMYIPYQTTPLLPSEHSGWWPRHYQLPLETDQSTFLLPDQMAYQIDPSHALNRALENNFGFRVSGSLKSFDFAAAYFEGANPVPILAPTLNATLISLQPTPLWKISSPVEIQPELYRIRRLAALASNTNSWCILKLSSQWNQPLGDFASQEGFSRFSVLEVEKAFSFKGQDLNLMAEWIESQRSSSMELATLTALMKKGWALGGRWALTENFVWTAGFYQEVTLHSHITTSHWNYKWNDAWTSDLAVTLLDGSTSSPLGIYRNNNQAELNLKYFLP